MTETSTPTGPDNQGSKFPWDGQPDYPACNFAFGTFMHNLRTRVTVNGRLHAETYLAAAGVIAGFAAQQALLVRAVSENDLVTLNQISPIMTKTGGFLQGRPLRCALLPETEALRNERLASVAANGAMIAGLTVAQTPKLEDRFTHVINSIGSEIEGMPSLGKEHYPGMPPKQLLKALWPFALMCLTGDAPESVVASKRLWPAQLGPASHKFWPAITAYVAGNVIHEVKDVLEPAKGLVIVMESAIYASMLDCREPSKIA
ncbi:hypothetical protein HX870_15545 [Pseudomonas gingeri]|uniref:hypothetical protein n=1 Tax=Pseudomonas gingeri TaxID=117681 RepID=UPI0015A0B8FA|nr:hypothetical protein [Pseudomonas gingeri]NWD69014.1 hypothetical protein [Pseudomonas gingeri]